MAGIGILLASLTAGWLFLKGQSNSNLLLKPADVPSCGLAWRTVEVPRAGKTYNELRGVAAIAPDNVWAVGVYGDSPEQYARTLLEHWDGTEWKLQQGPGLEGFSNHLLAVSARTPDDIWAVGAAHQGTENWRTLALRWDGATWSIVLTPNVAPINSLNAVAAISETEVWAVGESSAPNAPQGTQALIMRWDGTEWRAIDHGLTLQNSTLSAVVSADGTVWAAGSYSNKSGTVQRPLLARWDGSAWSQVEAPGDGQIWGLSALAADDVWAVGSFGPQTLALHWDGSAWTRIPTPNPGTGNNSLNAMTALSPTDIWAVGSFSRDGVDRVLTARWDGKEWKPVSAPSTGDISDVLWGVAAAPDGDVWAVGAYIEDAVGNNAPVSLRYSDPGQAAR